MPRYTAVLLFIFLFLYIVPLGYRPLMSPDETRYGEISREMLASADWVVPRLNGIRYFEKPILGHWLNALAMKALGKNAFAIRFPSAVATGLSGLLLFLVVRRFTDHAFPAYLSAMVFLTLAEVLVVGVTCILDSLLTLFVTAAMVCFFYYYHAPRSAEELVAYQGLSYFLTKKADFRQLSDEMPQAFQIRESGRLDNEDCVLFTVKRKAPCL